MNSLNEFREIADDRSNGGEERLIILAFSSIKHFFQHSPDDLIWQRLLGECC